MAKQHIVVLTGAGISAESGLKTFRDNDGLWENYNVYEVATPEAYSKDRELVLRFYNQRRAQLTEVKPNAGHLALQKLEDKFKVSIITQNIDDLHERAGSSDIHHLHGELVKVQSTRNPNLVEHWGYHPVEIGDKAPDGSQWRPHVVWFGEPVPGISKAAKICQTADHLLVVGTSLAVYPAAGLVHEIAPGVNVTVVDPGEMEDSPIRGANHIRKSAASALPELIEKWLDRGMV
ncbi:MAG: NAD-dependent deacylase [Flavobacteriia bacterium]|nr:NAD-dependent deacylase [Flavobacteriia bacterium]